MGGGDDGKREELLMFRWRKARDWVGYGTAWDVRHAAFVLYLEEEEE